MSLTLVGGKPQTCQDLPAEKLMADNGIKFTVGESVRARQDRKASRENAARHGKPILDEDVTRYMVAMHQNYVFPMPIVVRRKDTKLIDTIIGGNNRDAAWEKLGVTVYDAYIIEYDERRHDLLFNQLPKALNQLNGVPPQPEDILRDAINAVEPKKMKNLKQVAELYKLSSDLIRTHLQSNRLKAQVKDSGLDPAKVDATGTLLYEIWNFQPESVRIAMGRVAVVGGLFKKELRNMRDEVAAQPNEAAMMKTVELWAAAHPEKKKRCRDATGLAGIRRRFTAAYHNASSVVGQRKSIAELGYNVKDATDVGKAISVLQGLAEKTAILEVNARNILKTLQP